MFDTRTETLTDRIALPSPLSLHGNNKRNIFESPSQVDACKGSPDDRRTKRVRFENQSTRRKTTNNGNDERFFSFSLRRVGSSKNVDAKHSEPIGVFEGDVWGRTVVSTMTRRRPRVRIAATTRTESSSFVDLGIGYDCGKNGEDGVSRRHVQVISIRSEGVVVLVCASVKNPLSVVSGKEHRYFDSGSVILLKSGDVLIFDTYMKRPRHVFVLTENV